MLACPDIVILACPESFFSEGLLTSRSDKKRERMIPNRPSTSEDKSQNDNCNDKQLTKTGYFILAWQTD